MSRRPLARRLALTGGACATLILAGCTTTATSGPAVKGTTLSVYQSVPPGPLSPETQDVLSAEQLALRQDGNPAASPGGLPAHIGTFTVKLLKASRYELSANARAAIVDASTIAYLGEASPGTSAGTLGITNAQYVLQVSPTDTAVELTQSSPAVPGSPDNYYESLSANGRTFARVVPTTALEAKAVVSEMKALGVRRVYVVSDRSAYGNALRYAFVTRATGSITVTSSPSGVDAVFYAGSSATGAATAFNQAVSANPKAVLFAPSALAQNSFAASLSPAAQHSLYVSEPGFTRANLPAQAQGFVSAFRAAYGHDPATQAIFGYAAVQAVIQALRNAGSSAGSRSTVVHDFFALRNLNSVLGPFSIDHNGDTSIAPFVFSRVKAGRLVATVQAQG